MWKKFFIILMVLTLGFSLIGCASEISETPEETADSTEEDEPYLVFTDGMGREIVLEEEPMKVISVAPSVTETIYALGAEDKLIGRTDYCNYPEEASSVPSVGSLQEVNVEIISALEPDIVLASTHFKEETLNKIESLGIPVAMIFSQENFEGVYENIENIGLIVNREVEAKKVVEDMKNTVTTVKEKIENVEEKSVYYVIGYGEYGDYTATGDTFIGEMLAIAGGKNVAKEATGWKFSLEKLVEADPAVMIAESDESTMKGIEEANGYKDLTAIKNGKFYGVDKDMVSRMGPRLADGLLQIAKAIHPEVFQE